MTGKERMENVLKIYDNLENILNSLPDGIPQPIIDKVKEVVLNDKELKELMNAVKNPRKPRYLFIGNTGHGKSSLINAMLGYYCAKVSSVKIGTKVNNETYDIRDENGNILFSVLDSRGINESTTEELALDAEKQLLKDMQSFRPDAIIYVHKAKERASMNNEIDFLKKVSDNYKEYSNQQIPIIAVLSQCDELDPSSKKNPAEYNQTKINNICEAKEEVEKIIKARGLSVKNIIVVSALMEYEQSHEDLEKMTTQQIKELKPTLDGRYKIDELQEILVDSTEDIEVQFAAALAFNVQKVFEGISKKLIHAFTAIATTIALTPIPVSDVFVLCALEALLVMLIAALSGRDVSFKSAGELAVSFGGVGAVGFGARIAAQQFSKLVNGLFPGAGSAISSGIAAAGMESIGHAALKYYFKD